MPSSNMIVPDGGKSTMKLEGSTTGSLRLLGPSFYRKRLLYLTMPIIKKRYLQILEEIHQFQVCCSDSLKKSYFKVASFEWDPEKDQYPEQVQVTEPIVSPMGSQILEVWVTNRAAVWSSQIGIIAQSVWNKATSSAGDILFFFGEISPRLLLRLTRPWHKWPSHYEINSPGQSRDKVECTPAIHHQLERANEMLESRSSGVTNNLYEEWFRPSGTVCCIAFSQSTLISHGDFPNICIELLITICFCFSHS